MIRFYPLLLLAVGILLAGCPQPKSPDSSNARFSVDDMYLDEPIHNQDSAITVQHCLIAFVGTKTSKDVSRNQEEAEALANQLLAEAQSGADFDAIVKEHTDDAYPGIYKMVNHGLQANDSPGMDPEDKTYARSSMAKGFGDVGFSLEVGEIGMAEYNRIDSPFGFHIIKRLK